MDHHSKPRTALYLSLAFALIAFALGGWLSRPFVRLGLVASAVPEPRGALAVASLDIALALVRADGRGTGSVPVRLWFPAPERTRTAASLPRSALVLYVPAWGGKRDDNAAFTANLASHGFVVAAIDDIHWDSDELDETPADAAIRHTLFDFTNDASGTRMLAAFDRRLELEAAKVSSVLTSMIATSAQLPPGGQFDAARIGIVGASFGGAAAVESGLRDIRIGAVINFDGWLRGRAIDGTLAVPFANFNSTRGVPDPAAINAPNARPNHKFIAARNAETTAIIERHLAARSDTIDVTIAGANHGDFTDEIYERGRWMQWRPWRASIIAPARMHEVIDMYAAAFFLAHLGGQATPVGAFNPDRAPEISIRLGGGRVPG
jgi:dienelactone hydrolase